MWPTYSSGKTEQQGAHQGGYFGVLSSCQGRALHLSCDESGGGGEGWALTSPEIMTSSSVVGMEGLSPPIIS